MEHKCLKVIKRDSDFLVGDGQLKLTGATAENWLAHLDFFEKQRVSDGDTNDCWAYWAQEALDAQMDALISERKIPPFVVDWFDSAGFMDGSSLDGNPHFHTSPVFPSVLSGAGTGGAYLYTALDIFRKKGCIPWKLLPVSPSMTLAEYFAPIPQNLLDIGKQFLSIMGGCQFCQ